MYDPTKEAAFQEKNAIATKAHEDHFNAVLNQAGAQAEMERAIEAYTQATIKVAQAYATFKAAESAAEVAAAEACSAPIHTCAPNCKTCGDPMEDEDIQYCHGECAYCIEQRAFSQDESNIGFADKYCDE